MNACVYVSACVCKCMCITICMGVFVLCVYRKRTIFFEFCLRIDNGIAYFEYENGVENILYQLFYDMVCK